MTLTPEQIAAALLAARTAAGEAANAEVQKLKHDAAVNGGKPVEQDCGSASLLIQMDGRTKFAKALKAAADSTGVTVTRTGYRGRPYEVSIHPEINGDPSVCLQNMSIHVHGAKAAKETLNSVLGTKFVVHDRRD
ncbi:hypothetical protein [Comamonas sp. A7-5]|uniref:hypothetical protein n=1 Tax=Comamonas sp. A7-5 TaxID=673549 RepID=UPI0031DA0DD5